MRTRVFTFIILLFCITYYSSSEEFPPIPGGISYSTDIDLGYHFNYDYLINEHPDGKGFHAVIKVVGYTVRAYGAAHRNFDCLQFKITECDPAIKSFLRNRMFLGQDDKSITIDIAVPHENDPEQIVINSTKQSQVILIIVLMGDMSRGGVDTSNIVMMF